MVTLALDHVFVLCSRGAPEAAGLARLGVEEGSPNTHPGQGTRCRRFFFRNAYLELLWVEDEVEARSERVRPTRLWERWSGRRGEACPFGVVFRPGAAGAESQPPFETWPYHPHYLPPNLAIELAVGTLLSEPELFYLPWTRLRNRAEPEPIDHALPLREITGVTIGLPASRGLSRAAGSAEAAGLLGFRSADAFIMSLAFAGGGSGSSVDLRPELPLELRW
jgi:hypothetical protein